MLPTRPVPTLEVQAVSIAVGVGLWLGCAQSFSSTLAPIYQYMRSVNEWVWSCALLTGAILTVLGILGGSLNARRLGLMVISLVWLLMATCFFAANSHAFTVWTYASLAVSAGYSSLRL